MEDEYMQNLRNIMRGLAEELHKSGHPVDLENFDERFNQAGEKLANDPNEEFNGFSSKQMHAMCNFQFEEGCPVQLRHLTEEEIVEIPIIRQALHLMKSLDKKDIRLNPNGTLPIKMVNELYELVVNRTKEYSLQQRTEENIYDVKVLRLVLKETGLTAVKKGKLYLTVKGKDTLSDHNALLRTIILYLFREYNTGWYDQMGWNSIGNQGRLYSLWLLHHFGGEWHPLTFYQEEYFKAFETLIIAAPQMAEYYPYRVFHNLFAIIGICELNEGKDVKWEDMDKEVRKTPILDMMFSFQEPEEM